MDNPIEKKGAIAWMARNPVAANLLMAVLILGGLLIGSRVKQEVFPEFDLDQVQITVPYPGGSPAEVEQGIILSIEDEVRGLDGVKRVLSKSFEGGGSVTVELLRGADPNKALQDIKNAVDRITTFPKDSERPVVSRISTRREVISLVVCGNQSERTLRQTGERIRDELLQSPGITLIELDGIRPLEISIEVPQATLRAHGLTLEDISQVVAQTAIELPAGGVKTEGGEILLRTAERRDLGPEFEDITIVSKTDGTEVKLVDIAEIVDGFADTDQAALWNGKPAVMIKVYRVGDQTPVEVAKAVREYKARVEKTLPAGIALHVWFDWSVVYNQRVSLLLRNAAVGLVLVLVLLGLFLELRLAFWVTMGIPISFLGALFFMPAMGVSVNMLSLFAFILTLGIVVDDAIIVGENIYKLRQSGMPFLPSAIQGARQIAVPVTFSVLTNIEPFAPMMFIPGVMGKFFWVIPAIVLPIFLISLVESLFILPAHLGHLGPARQHGLRGWVHRQQQRFSRFIEFCIARIYEPTLKACLRVRYLTMAVAVAVLVLVVVYTLTGRIAFVFRPKVSIDLLTVNAVLPYGAPIEETQRVQERLVNAAQGLAIDEYGQEVIRGIFTEIGGGGQDLGHMPGAASVSGSHLATVIVSLIPPEEQEHLVDPAAMTKAWRDRVGDIPGVESLTYSYTLESGQSAHDRRVDPFRGAFSMTADHLA